jgi:Zn-finger nucleic acid-binding protein
LEENEYRGSIIDICPECAGLWFDAEEFGYHASERDTFTDPTIPRVYLKHPLEEKKSYLKCVRCEAVMVRRNFRKISGVLIDICRDHGVWLDAGELEQIRCFIANGGLNKSQDRQISTNSDTLSKLASEITDLNTLFKTLNKWDVKRILLQGF